MNIIIIFILLQGYICLDLKAYHFAVIIWWRQSVFFFEWETLLCRFKWRQPVWQRLCVTPDAPSRNKPVIMMHSQPLQTYKYLSCIFNAARSSALLDHIGGELSGNIWQLQHLTQCISVTCNTLQFKKVQGLLDLVSLIIHAPWWIKHEYATSVWMYSQRTMLVELKVS